MRRPGGAIRRCALLSALAVTALSPAHGAGQTDAGAAARPKVLHVCFFAEAGGFDPARPSSGFSNALMAHVFEAPYQYDPLARPVRITPLTAVGMPEVSDDFRTWTVHIRPGITFADDPAFKGQPRELVARDFAYAYLRAADPTNRSEMWPGIDEMKILGLSELHQAYADSKKPFDYDREVEGLRLLDRYTLQFRFAKPNPRLLDTLAASGTLGAVAREVVEFYGDRIAEHPVGTGPFRLKAWRRASEIVLERNPGYRERLYDAEPAPDDAEGQAILARLKGRRIPMVDEVRIAILAENQPRWLSFLNGQLDLIGERTCRMPSTFVPQAMRLGQVAPHLARRGIQGRQSLGSLVNVIYFNMEDPVVGGYAPAQVALRRAIGLAQDVERAIRIGGGQAIPAQSVVSPYTTGYDPRFKSEAGDYDPARARALLDLYGYADRDGDGWRERPDGSPLVVVKGTMPELSYRQGDAMWQKNLAAIGVRTRFDIAQWPELLKKARAGKLQVFGYGTSSGQDGQGALGLLYGPEAGSGNPARFKLPAFDAIYDQMSVLPDGPAREALFLQAKKLSIAYMPYKPMSHVIDTELWHSWVIGFRRPLFWNEWWHLVDLDADLRARTRR